MHQEAAILFISARQKCTEVVTSTGGKCRCQNDPGVARGHGAGLTLGGCSLSPLHIMVDSLSPVSKRYFVRHLVRDGTKSSSVLLCHLSILTYCVTDQLPKYRQHHFEQITPVLATSVSTVWGVANVSRQIVFHKEGMIFSSFQE